MRTIIFITFILSSWTACAQSSLKGQVKSKAGEEIFAANVYLKNNLQKGTQTDFNGKFELSLQSEDLKDTLVISYLGYASQEYVLENLDIDQNLAVVLKQDQQSLVEVIIKAKSPISEQFAVTKLDRLQIYTNPIAQGDPLKAITGLAASTNVDESANPALRGSSAGRSLVVFNKVPVRSPVRNSQINGLGFFSLFNPEIIKSQYVYASNPPLTYGNASAGLVEIQTQDELNTSNIQLAASLAGVGIFSSNIINEKSFVQAYGNIQFSKPFIELNRSNLPNLNAFSNKDVGLNYHHELTESLNINFFNYLIDESYSANAGTLNYWGTAEGGRLRNFSIGNVELRGNNGVTSLNMGFDTRKTNYGFGNIDINNKARDLYVALHHQWLPNDSYSLEAGVAYTNRWISLNDQVPQLPFALSPESPILQMEGVRRLSNLEFFTYQSWKPFENTTLTAGVRSNLPTEDQSDYVSFQLGWRQYFNTSTSILLSGGFYHNYSAPNFFNSSFALLTSRQLSLDVEHIQEDYKLKAALFYKKESGEFIDEFLVSNGQETFGIEFSAEKQFGRYFEASLANTFLDQHTTFGSNRYRGSLDLNYFVKAQVSFVHPKLFSASLIYVTRPGTFFTPLEDAVFDGEELGTYIPIFSDVPNSAQYTDYNNLSFSLSKYKSYDGGSWTAFLNINNILNIRNQQSIYFDSNFEQAYNNYFQLRTIYFGVVLSFVTD